MLRNAGVGRMESVGARSSFFNRFDGAAYYKINPDYRLQLNVENLFGRRYIATADGNNNIQPGSPRAFKVSLVANF